MNHSSSLLIYSFIVLSLVSANCTNGQSYNNIYTEESWEERDKWQKPELIIEHLNIMQGDNVADLGSHEGYMTVKLANHVGIGGRVFAVDVNKYRLTQLQKNLEAVPFIKGVNNHMGSKLTAESSQIYQIFSVLKNQFLQYYFPKVVPYHICHFIVHM